MTKFALNSLAQNRLLRQINGRSIQPNSALEQGFTLVELLVVVVILGVLSSIALPSFLNQQDKANISAANTQGKNLMQICQLKILDPAETIPASLTSGKTFGKLTWTPTVTVATGGALTACSSVTTGTGVTTQQNFVLDTATGNLTTETLAAK